MRIQASLIACTSTFESERIEPDDGAENCADGYLILAARPYNFPAFLFTSENVFD
jgi:hypothetical protein